MFPVRDNEPEYAKLADQTTEQLNRYGLNIETVPEHDPRRGEALVINDEVQAQQNPNRYKQHGFFFNADNCIACHACEAACSEKNDNPAHLAFRSVGFVEGGTYPAYQRINISMACNHCDDPVCLKGCPTRAYTKFAEYGAVLQDPDICFGCGYCTWVCPYNAPQLDPVQGQVSKCNMCVDRLEVGLKPACVSACLGKALEFGVIENLPEGANQAKTQIPGFPTPEISHPNIRFQQQRTPEREMKRVDGAPLKYQRDDDSGGYKPVVDDRFAAEREWNWKKLLGSHENAHVMFTLSTQAVLGAFFVLVFGGWLGFAPAAALGASSIAAPLLLGLVALMAFGLFKLNMHLGKPHRFYRGFNNLRHSPVSREIAGVSAFFGSLVGYALFAWFDNGFATFMRGLFGLTALIGGLAGLYYMYKLYRIPARPFWNHWQTGSAFVGSALGLGGLILALTGMATGALTDSELAALAGVAIFGLALEAVGLFCHAKDLKRAGEGAAAYFDQTHKFGYPYWLRNGVLALAILLGAGVVAGVLGPVALWPLAVLMLVSAIIGRALFYVVVIPTTMPGAFFWKNKNFVEHARETGLADMPQLGVAYEHHHPFKLGELLKSFS